MCENHGNSCTEQHHFYCLGLAFPLPADEEWFCKSCEEACGRSSEPKDAHLRLARPGERFDCVICLTRKPGLEKVAVSGCDHSDFVCSACMFDEIYLYRPKCPLCRRDATAVVQVATGARTSVEVDEVDEEDDDDEEDREEADAEAGFDEVYEEAEPAVFQTPIEQALEQMRTGETVLDLNDRHLSNLDAAMLAAELRVNSTLTILNLNGNHISSAAKELGAALRVNKTLRRLHLDNNDIGDGGAARLANGLQAADGGLRLLSLHDNHAITRTGARALQAASHARESASSLQVFLPWSACEEDDEEADRTRVRSDERARKRQRVVIQEENDDDDDDDEGNDEEDDDDDEDEDEEDDDAPDDDEPDDDEQEFRLSKGWARRGGGCYA